jgi:lipopolysaccharide export system permease protein
MSTLTRYLLRQLAAPFAYALAALTGIMLLGQIAKQLGKLVGKGLPTEVIAEVFVLSVPFILAMTLPLAVLTAALWTTVRLGADSELIACWAGGISPWRVLRPILLWAIVMAGVEFAFVDQVLPRTNARLRALQTDIQRKRPTLALREQAVNALSPSPYFLRAGRIDPATGRLTDVTLFDVSGALTRRIMYADSGVMAFTANGRDLALALFDGEVHQVRSGPPEEFEVTSFRRADLRVKELFDSLSRTQDGGVGRSDRELGTCEMHATVDTARHSAFAARAARAVLVRQDLRHLLGLPDRGEQPDTLRTALHVPRYCAVWSPFVRDTVAPPPPPLYTGPMDPGTAVATTGRLSTFAETVSLRDAETAAQQRADRFAVEIHKKFSLAVACLTFTLVGVPVAARFPRGGVGLVLGAGLAVYAIYFAGLSAGETLADRGYVRPATAMWLSNIILAVIALTALVLVRHGGGHARAGSGTVESLVEWWRGRRRRGEDDVFPDEPAAA